MNTLALPPSLTYEQLTSVASCVLTVGHSAQKVIRIALRGIGSFVNALKTKGCIQGIYFISQQVAHTLSVNSEDHEVQVSQHTRVLNTFLSILAKDEIHDKLLELGVVSTAFIAMGCDFHQLMTESAFIIQGASTFARFTCAMYAVSSCFQAVQDLREILRLDSEIKGMEDPDEIKRAESKKRYKILTMLAASSRAIAFTLVAGLCLSNPFIVPTLTALSTITSVLAFILDPDLKDNIKKFISDLKSFINASLDALSLALSCTREIASYLSGQELDVLGDDFCKEGLFI